MDLDWTGKILTLLLFIALIISENGLLCFRCSSKHMTYVLSFNPDNSEFLIVISWMFTSSWNAYVKILTPNVMALGDGAFVK